MTPHQEEEFAEMLRHAANARAEIKKTLGKFSLDQISAMGPLIVASIKDQDLLRYLPNEFVLVLLDLASAMFTTTVNEIMQERNGVWE